MKILCLDQATKISGFSIWENKKLIKYGLLEVDSNEKNPIERMKLMSDLIINLIKSLSPSFVVIEDVQFQKNQATFLQLAQMQGVLMQYFFSIDIGFQIVKPSVWKGFCGIKGRKREEQKLNTILFVKDRYGFDCSEDESDAVGIGYYASQKVKVN